MPNSTVTGNGETLVIASISECETPTTEMHTMRPVKAMKWISWLRERLFSWRRVPAITSRYGRTSAALLGMVALGSTGYATPPDRTPHYYTQADFRLPFELHPTGRRPEQLDLLVSNDGGSSWRIHQTAQPADGAFEVKDAAEGDYVLAVQARDQSSAIVSRRTVFLTVDQTPPVAELTCQWDGQQTIAIEAMLSDRNLTNESARLSVRIDPQEEPIPLQCSVERVDRDHFKLTSSMNLVDCNRFELELAVRDQAGNETRKKQTYNCPSRGWDRISLQSPAPSVTNSSATAQPTEGSSTAQPVAKPAENRPSPIAKATQQPSISLVSGPTQFSVELAESNNRRAMTRQVTPIEVVEQGSRGAAQYRSVQPVQAPSPIPPASQRASDRVIKRVIK